MADTPVSARRTPRWVAFIAVVALASSTLFAPSVGAQEDGVEIPTDVTIIRERPSGKVIFDAPQARVYDDQVNPDGGPAEWVVVGGGSIIDVCTNPEPPPPGRAMFYERPNGTYVGKSLPGGIEVETHVYKSDMEVFAFFDAVCGAYFEQGTPMPAAFASGFATLELKAWGIRDITEWMNPQTPQPPGKYLNGLTGQVADADGNVYALTTVADFTVRRNGQPDFHELSVTMEAVTG